MARSEVILKGYSSCDVLSIGRVDRINEFEHGDGFMYYVKNVFRNYNDMPEFKIYAFKIVKETDCFYFLSNKQRIMKQSSYQHMKISSSPQEALQKAIKRANAYLNILLQRAKEVEHMLRTVDATNSRHALKELKTFEKYAAGVDDTDLINPKLLKAMSALDRAFQDLGAEFGGEIPY